MSEKSIVFSAESVQAILNGRKTITRRLIKPSLVARFDEGRGPADTAAGYPFVEDAYGDHISVVKLCPYGEPSDLLWVRETWAAEEMGSRERIGIHYRATDMGKYKPSAIVNRPVNFVLKKAAQSVAGSADGCWRSPRFMPRWASRITLRITDVRVERLQDISEEAAEKEGIEISPQRRAVGIPFYKGVGVNEWHIFARDAFAQLWNSINGKDAPWESNPWVWAISFERVKS